MKIPIDFKFILNKDQWDKLFEMVKWLAGDNIVHSNYYDNYTIMEKGQYSTTSRYVNYMQLLLFQIPLALGMDVVIVDPENPDMLIEQIYEKYMIYNNIQEKSKKKPRYKSTEGNKMFSDEEFLDRCIC